MWSPGNLKGEERGISGEDRAGADLCELGLFLLPWNVKGHLWLSGDEKDISLNGEAVNCCHCNSIYTLQACYVGN